MFQLQDPKMLNNEDEEFSKFQDSLLSSCHSSSKLQISIIPQQTQTDTIEEVIQDQDKEVRSLLVSVQRQKELARCINNELDVQNAMITEMTSNASKTKTTLEKQKTSLERILERFF